MPPYAASLAARQDVQRALAAAGYIVCNRLAKGEWVCLAAKLAA